jgi:hypothetical protein
MNPSLLGLHGLHEVFNVHPVFVHFPIALFPTRQYDHGAVEAEPRHHEDLEDGHHHSH